MNLCLCLIFLEGILKQNAYVKRQEDLLAKQKVWVTWRVFAYRGRLKSVAFMRNRTKELVTALLRVVHAPRAICHAMRPFCDCDLIFPLGCASFLPPVWARRCKRENPQHADSAWQRVQVSGVLLASQPTHSGLTAWPSDVHPSNLIPWSHVHEPCSSAIAAWAV